MRILLPILALSCGLTLPAFATTKGLNQIVTPDIQPRGQLSISYQQQDPSIGNSSQVQLELGLTDRFELALFQGLNPHQTMLATELGVIQKDPYLLSVGFTGWSSGAAGNTSPQPFVLGGWYEGRHKVIAGAIRVSDHTEAILGYGYQYTPKLLLDADYQSGPGNSVTAGFTYNILPNLSLNPAIYLPNDAPRTMHGYAVLSWTVQVFK